MQGCARSSTSRRFANIQPDASLTPAQFESIVNRLNGSLGESIFAAMKANRTFFDPTLVGYEASIGNATPALAERRKFAYEKMKVIAGQAARAGVPIITGTDVLNDTVRCCYRNSSDSSRLA